MNAFQRRSALIGSGATPHNRMPKPFSCALPALSDPRCWEWQYPSHGQPDVCGHERWKHWRTTQLVARRWSDLVTELVTRLPGTGSKR